MWLHRSIRLVLMLVCIALGTLAILSYIHSASILMLVFVVSSFCVAIVQPLGMAKKRWLQMPLLPFYVFHLATTIDLIVMRDQLYTRYLTVILILAIAGCILLCASAVLMFTGGQEKNIASDIESTATACSDQLSLNKAAKEKQEVTNKASQKTLVRDASGSTLQSDRASHIKRDSSYLFDTKSNRYGEDPRRSKSLVESTYGPTHRPKSYTIFVPEKSTQDLNKSVESSKQPKRSSMVSEPEIMLAKALMASHATLNEYCQLNWMSPALSHFPLLPMLQEAQFSSLDVHRSKLVGQLHVSRQRPSQRRLIDEEKAFLQNVHENLLPAVLKQGVSPIQKSKSRFSFDKESYPDSKDDVSCPDKIMEGLEEIPMAASQWTKSKGGLRQISLDDWEKNKGHWLQQNLPVHQPLPQSDLGSFVLSSAPSLHTYRRNSEGSARQLVAVSDRLTLAPCVTPIQAPTIVQSTNSSPIKKVLGIFRRRSSEDITVQHYQHHHLGSVATASSEPYSAASGKSLNRGLPKRAIRSFLRLHKPSSSIYTPNNPPPVPAPPPPIPILFNMPTDPLFRHSSGIKPYRLPSDEWASDHTPLDQSRVSSLPSAIIGEYDKEKWRKLKELEEAVAKKETTSEKTVDAENTAQKTQ